MSCALMGGLALSFWRHPRANRTAIDFVYLRRWIHEQALDADFARIWASFSRRADGVMPTRAAQHTGCVRVHLLSASRDRVVARSCTGKSSWMTGPGSSVATGHVNVAAPRTVNALIKGNRCRAVHLLPS